MRSACLGEDAGFDHGCQFRGAHLGLGGVRLLDADAQRFGQQFIAGDEVVEAAALRADAYGRRVPTSPMTVTVPVTVKVVYAAPGW